MDRKEHQACSALVHTCKKRLQPYLPNRLVQQTVFRNCHLMICYLGLDAPRIARELHAVHGVHGMHSEQRQEFFMDIVQLLCRIDAEPQHVTGRNCIYVYTLGGWVQLDMQLQEQYANFVHIIEQSYSYDLPIATPFFTNK